MPYIKQADREVIDRALATAKPNELSAGQIAYFVYRILRDGVAGQGGTFAAMATVVGAVVLTTLRYVDDEVMTYEDAKEQENGGIK